MSETSGRYVPVSRFRRLVADLMHFSLRVPTVTIERRIDLSRLLAARQACTPSPTWSALFIKAYARVAVGVPEIRTSYMTFPRPKFHENPVSIATLNIDRQFAGERGVLQVHIPSPETLTLHEIDGLIRDYQTRPVEEIAEYRAAARLARVPWPLRRWIWWAGINVSGPMRVRHFGTFSITSLGSEGCGITHFPTLQSTTVHYGMLDAAGVLEMRLSFDHRVLDGATAAKALVEMERVLVEEMPGECGG